MGNRVSEGVRLNEDLTYGVVKSCDGSTAYACVKRKFYLDSARRIPDTTHIQHIVYAKRKTTSVSLYMAKLTIPTNGVPTAAQATASIDVTQLTPQEMANIASGLPSGRDKLSIHTPISLKQNSYASKRKNNHQKFFMKMHEISRLSVAMVKDDQICYLVGITRPRLHSIRAMPEFMEIQETEFNQHMARMSGQIAQRGDVIRTALANEVPTALATIRDCMRGKDLRVRLEAAKEWLDREGNFVKGRPNGTSSIGGFQVPESAFAEAQQMGDSIAQGAITPNTISTPNGTQATPNGTTLPPNQSTSQTQSPSPIDLSSTPAASPSVN